MPEAEHLRHDAYFKPDLTGIYHTKISAATQMNILWLSHLMPYPPKGGVYQRSYNLMKELSKYNNLYLICFSQKSQQENTHERQAAIKGLSELGEVLNVFLFDSDKSSAAKLKLIISSIFTKTPYTVNWLSAHGVEEAISTAIKQYNIDIVHHDTISWAKYLSSETTTANHYKAVLNHHNIESHMMLRRARKTSNIFKKLYFMQEGYKLHNYENKICPRYDLNITCSDTDTLRLKRRIPYTNTQTIPNGVDMEYFTPSKTRQRANSLIFAGGLSWYPNIAAMDFFMHRVWPDLIRSIPNASMTIVGRTPPQWLKDLASKYKEISVTGFVDDVRPLIEAASVYVCPINDGGGTKLKILDALAMKKAIVAHPVACEGIDVTEGENILFAETKEQYIEKITALFNNEALRTKLGNNGRKLIADKYDYTIIGKKLNNLYKDLALSS